MHDFSMHNWGSENKDGSEKRNVKKSFFQKKLQNDKLF